MLTLLAVALGVLGFGAVLLVASLRRPGAAREEPCPSCGRMMLASWTECLFCHAPRGYKKPQLEFVSGPLAGQVVALDGEVTTIGSAPGSTVALQDVGVSRKHAGIRRDGSGFELADLGSTNGVYVNGEKVARRRLAPGDVIRVGSTEMVFKG